MFYEVGFKYMVHFGGGRKKVRLPAEPSSAPTPEQIDIEAQRKAEDIRRKLKARAGRAGTILTEGGLGMAEIGKNVLLGGGVA